MIPYIPAVISGALSAALIRSGVPAFFFLVPIGFMAYGYTGASAWVSAGIGVGANAILSLGIALAAGNAYPWLDTAYFTLMTAVFTGITAPPARQIGPVHLTLPYRFIFGSFFGAFLFLLAIRATLGSFDAFLRVQGELLSSLYIASAGTDVVQRALLEQYATPETVVQVLTTVLLRGGGLVSCLLIFFISRQISLLFVRLIRRVSLPEQISRFYTAPWLIWVLSFSLLGVLLTKLASLRTLEIPVWNILTMCVILYLAQGWGIVWHFFAHRELSPVLRLALNILIIILLFSPGINLVFIGLLILLGIAEHWAPLRALKSDKPSSTPGT